MRSTAAIVLVLGTAQLVACSGLEQATSAITASPTASAGSTSITSATKPPRSSAAITVETPLPNAEVASPVSVSGAADVDRARVTIRVLDSTGAELVAMVVRASCGDGCRGTFSTDLFFFAEAEQGGAIEVSGSTDGAAAVTRVPVTLAPG